MDAVERHRRDYVAGALDVADVAADPLVQLALWIDDAVAAAIDEPNAMTLATVAANGEPDARIVLLRRIDEDALVWFTDRTSAKGEQLATNPRAALVFHWQALERQVRVQGPVEPLDAAASDAYFATRPRGSRIGAWASDQSRPIADRAALEHRVAEVEARFADDEVPRPPSWGGYRLLPTRVEFWQGRRSRLHDRIVYLPEGDVAGRGPWRLERLQP